METWYVYITDKAGRYYVGITTDLDSRMRQHGGTLLLYFEGPMSRAEAVIREKSLKGWSRRKKEELIKKGSLQRKVSLP